MPRLTELFHTVAEQVGDVTRSLWPYSWSGTSLVRSNIFTQRNTLRFWDTGHPIEEGSTVNFEITRSLYRNDSEARLGSFVAKPIVDLQVGFMGLPVVSTANETLSERLNECIQEYWTDGIQQVFRDSIRDSKVIVKIFKPDIFDPLMTIEEAEHCKIECISPERVDLEYNPRNKEVLDRALIRHKMVFIIDDGSVEEGRDPQVEEHDVLEIIDRQRVKFWDQTASQWLDNLSSNNPYGFVNLMEVHNEWDTSLQGGMSDLEPVIPFMQALHDVVTQGLQAHKYHSTPKLKFKLADVGQFIKANFPDVWDDSANTIKEGSTISWRGQEIVFLQSDDDAGFIEAKSVLGDTKILAEFIIDCICIASQTPEWAFMRVDSGSANSDRNAQTVPFVKKIERKRNNYTHSVQRLLKMAQLIMGQDIPVVPKISWRVVRVDDLMIQMQAFQQLIMGLEVAAQRGEISDETYRHAIRTFLPHMKASSQEERDAQASVQRNAEIQRQLAPPTPVVAGPQGENE